MTLIPKLRKIQVSPEKLILDPNNPRLITREEDSHQEADALDLLDNTIDRMRGQGEDTFKIKELQSSILQNGWWPVDFIFVKKYDDYGRYLVLEGNRRVTAIRNIRNDESIDKKIKDSLSLLDVMEIIGEDDEEKLKEKITYLLGVRHHGSLKKWSPFAQARNIYSRYLELSKKDEVEFEWDRSLGKSVANALSIDVEEVRNRLCVYKVMERLANDSAIKASEIYGGGIKDRYYSVCSEVALTKDGKLKEYITVGNDDFSMSDEHVRRFNNLCHFDRKNREGAPINNPQEWRKLANILKDDDVEKRREMLAQVEVQKKRPSVVYAERSVELQALQWNRWLRKVSSILKEIRIVDNLSNSDAKFALEGLQIVISELDNRDI